MEEEVALQGVFKDRENRDANAARHMLYFGKGFNLRKATWKRKGNLGKSE